MAVRKKYLLGILICQENELLDTSGYIAVHHGTFQMVIRATLNN